MLSWITTLLSSLPIISQLLSLFHIDTGKTGQEIINIANLTQTDITNYDAGQAVVVATVPPSWVPGATQNGVIVAMQDGGAAYQQLFG